MPACYRPCFRASFCFFHAQCTYSINQIKSATMVPSPTLPSRVSRHRSVNTVTRATRSSRALAIERRAAAKLARVPPPPRDMQIPILKRIVALLKEREGGKKGRGILKGLIEEHVHHFPWLTWNMVDYYIVTYTYDNLVPLDIDTSINNQTAVSVVSGLTDASPVALATANVTATDAPTGTTITTPGSESVSTSKRCGRPAGKTKSIIEGRKALVADAMDECAIQIANVKSMAMHKTHTCGKTCRVRQGTYKKVIEKVCDKYNIESNDTDGKSFEQKQSWAQVESKALWYIITNGRHRRALTCCDSSQSCTLPTCFVCQRT
jgi:hypothetical protein